MELVKQAFIPPVGRNRSSPSGRLKVPPWYLEGSTASKAISRV